MELTYLPCPTTWKETIKVKTEAAGQRARVYITLIELIPYTVMAVGQ